MTDTTRHRRADTIDRHGPYMSDADEAEIIERVGADADVADLALRTCMCGRRLSGFDDYYEHLRVVIREAAPTG